MANKSQGVERTNKHSQEHRGGQENRLDALKNLWRNLKSQVSSLTP